MEIMISIVVATYKRPELLRRCLNSIPFLYQSLVDVLVIDDDPNMSGADVVSEFNSIRYFSKRGFDGGLSNSRNLGINLAIGKYLIFIDDDDFFDFEQ